MLGPVLNFEVQRLQAARWMERVQQECDAAGLTTVQDAIVIETPEQAEQWKAILKKVNEEMKTWQP